MVHINMFTNFQLSDGLPLCTTPLLAVCGGEVRFTIFLVTHQDHRQTLDWGGSSLSCRAAMRILAGMSLLSQAHC